MNDPTNPAPRPEPLSSSREEAPDAVTLLRRQHDEIRDLMDAVATGATEVRRQAFEALVPLLAVHETAEELAVYPKFKRMGVEAERIAETRLMEEDQAKKVLAELEGMNTDDPSFATIFLEFQRSVEMHAESEEREVFPLLAQGSTVEELAKMGESVMRAERFAPTHAHRAAPESAIGNMVMGPVAAVIDRVRDALARD